MQPTPDSLKQEVQKVATTLEDFLTTKGYYGDQFEFVPNQTVIEFIESTDPTILVCSMLSILARVKTNISYLERVTRRHDNNI